MSNLAPSFICSDVRVRNLPRSVRFYRALGLRPAAETRMEDGTDIVWLRDPRTGQLLEVFRLSPRSPLYEPFRPSRSSANALLFSIPDVRRLLPRLRRLGARPVTEFEEGGVRLTFLRDPDGTLIELLSWTERARGSRRGSPLLALALRGRAKRGRKR